MLKIGTCKSQVTLLWSLRFGDTDDDDDENHQRTKASPPMIVFFQRFFLLDSSVWLRKFYFSVNFEGFVFINWQNWSIIL
jgi:hypothetical protein